MKAFKLFLEYYDVFAEYINPLAVIMLFVLALPIF